MSRTTPGHVNIDITSKFGAVRPKEKGVIGRYPHVPPARLGQAINLVDDDEVDSADQAQTLQQSEHLRPVGHESGTADVDAIAAFVERMRAVLDDVSG